MKAPAPGSGALHAMNSALFAQTSFVANVKVFMRRRQLRAPMRHRDISGKNYGHPFFDSEILV
jgi:hypothetical protein